MEREFSSGGVLVRRFRGRWWLAAIRPGGKPDGMWALPKGNIGRDEDPEATAVREVGEETGIEAVSTGKLGDVRYVYTRGGKRIFKVVSFYLLRYRSGRIDDLPTAFRHEVDRAQWLPLEDAPRLLAYKSEREMAEKALAALEEETV
ncbi:MAG TPA: NUDIX domain-containing protein [Gaiellaceae bacterium]|nr:NUDIX domain-containing protein [Gaiellaceae bacterium]